MKDIPGYEGLYRIGEDGRVWNQWQKELKPTVRGSRRSVKLYRLGTYRTWTIDQLVSVTYGFKGGSKVEIMVELMRQVLEPTMKTDEFVAHMTRGYLDTLMERKKSGPTRKG